MSFLNTILKIAAPIATAFGGPVGLALGGLAGAAAYKDYKNSQKATKAAEDSRRYIEEMAAKTQNQLFQLYPQIQQTNADAYNLNMDVMGKTFPASMNAMLGGNMNAQKTISAALPRANAAILGGMQDFTDYSEFAPRELQIDPATIAALTNPNRLSFAPIDTARLS
jgi:hypothetical protein